MNFNQALYEYSEDVLYKEWMEKQVKLWKQLVDKHIVDKEDLIKFKKFGRFFDLFYKKTHHFPTITDVERAIV